MSYYKWPVGSDISLFLEIIKSDGTGLVGSDPQVMIRRYRNVDGSGFLDDYFWNGTTFVPTATSASMVELDSTNQPGVYVYAFSQSLIQSASVYNVMYKHNRDPVGFTTERHYFTLTGSDGDVKVYDADPD